MKERERNKENGRGWREGIRTIGAVLFGNNFDNIIWHRVNYSLNQWLQEESKEKITTVIQNM